MKFNISMAQCLIILLFMLACESNSNPEPEPEPEEDIVVTYTESPDDFPNPERGFYEYSETRASSYQALSENQLKSYRNPKNGSGASYKTVSTLVFRYYVLDTFLDGPISEEFLTKIEADYATARKAGVKIIVRFAYTISAPPGVCAEGSICPPYGDAPKEIVLSHIEQLKPSFQENSDVISCVQIGFIGIWGENYYTDYFGDASANGEGKLLDENWQDRFDVLSALLDATPSDIMIQVRYPQMKQRFIYGVNALANSAPLSEEEAFTDSDKARIAFHNDCLMASADDYGTYTDYGNSSSPRAFANTTLRKYFSEDSKYVVVGGETCADGYSPQNDCEPTGKAQKELSDMHYTYLNADYNAQVNNDWETGGCIEEIKKNLGYRFVLKSGTYTASVKTSDTLNVKIELENVGYASPFKARTVVLLLRNKASGDIHSFELDTEIRKWFTGNVVLNGAFKITSDIPAGEYELLLNLPDTYESISTRPEYSIRLANTEVWEEATGFNKLLHTVTVE